MLTIKLGNTYAQLKEASIPIVLRSPVFLDEKNNGSYLFNFNVILTPELKKELGYINKPASITKVFSVNAEIRYNELIYTGKARVKGVNENEVTVFLPANNGQLAWLQKNISLRDIDTGGNRRTFEHLSRARVIADDWVELISFTSYSDTHDLNFRAIEADYDSLFIDDGDAWKAPTSGQWEIFLNVAIRRLFGQNFRIHIFKNGLRIRELPLTFPTSRGISTFTETGTRMIRVKTTLQQNDIITFKIVAEGSMTRPEVQLGSGRDPDAEKPAYEWLLEYVVTPTTSVGFYFNFSMLEATGKQYPDSDIAVFPVNNPGFYADASTSRYLIDDQDMAFLNEKFPVINYFLNNEFPYTISGQVDGESFSVFNTMVPFPYLSACIKWLLQRTGTTIDGNPFEHNEINQISIVAMNAINAFDLAGFTTLRDFYNLTDLLPQIAISDFFADHCRMLGIVFQYDGFDNRIRMKSLNDIMNDRNSVEFSNNITIKPSLTATQYDGYKLTYSNNRGDKFFSENVKPLEEVNLKEQVATLNDLPQLGNEADDCRFVVSEKCYYTWVFDKETTEMSWQFYSIDFNPVRIELFDDAGDDPALFDYTLPVSPLMMLTRKPQNDTMFGAAQRQWLIAATETPGYFKGLPQPEHNWGVLFYRGMQKDSLNSNYPLGSNGYTDYAGNVVGEDPLSMDFTDDPNSLWSRRLKPYVLWRAKTEGTYTMQKVMTAREIAAIDFFSWYTIFGTDYLIKEMRFVLKESIYFTVEFDIVSRITRNV